MLRLRCGLIPVHKQSLLHLQRSFGTGVPPPPPKASILERTLKNIFSWKAQTYGLVAGYFFSPVSCKLIAI
jgi:hypothetical protein